MAETHRLLKSARYRNLFTAIAEQDMRKMPCGDIRVAILLRNAGLILLVGKRQDVTTSWKLTEIGEKYVDRA